MHSFDSIIYVMKIEKRYYPPYNSSVN